LFVEDGQWVLFVGSVGGWKWVLLWVDGV
jgi:hypothetical protein